MSKLTDIPETTRALIYRIMLFATIIAVCVALVLGVQSTEILLVVAAIGSLIPQVMAVLNTSLTGPSRLDTPPNER